jgi:hypothetical protein
MARENLGIMEGGKGKQSLAPTRGAIRARAMMERFLASNTTRSQLPAELVKSLGDIRMAGNALLGNLEPYKNASIFSLRFAAKLYGSLPDGRTEKERETNKAFKETPNDIRRVLDDASKHFMPGRFGRFPQSDKDVETTCAIAGYFFLGAAARYCPEILMEDLGTPANKAEAAKEFAQFYDSRIRPLSDINRKWGTAKEFHDECFRAYSDLKERMPALFDGLRSRLWVSKGKLLAPYGSKNFDVSWRTFHYSGSF